MRIREEFRRSMGWFHTWIGIALSGLLFVIFWMGTLSVFDQEIDQWMIPELRSANVVRSLDGPWLNALSDYDIQAGSSVYINMPTERRPIVSVYAELADGTDLELSVSSETGQIAELTQSDAGTGFFFPFHFSLHLSWNSVGRWIVGFASIAMLALIVSGVFIHRKIFADFFTFRPKRQLRRSSLDLHNLASVIALPFHILFPLSALLIFASIYFELPMSAPYGANEDALYAELYGNSDVRAATGATSEPLTKLDRYVKAAEEMWIADGADPLVRASRMVIELYGDMNTYVTIATYFPESDVAILDRKVFFDPLTHEVIGRFDQKPLQSVSGWLEGAHFMQFDHWPIRWLFFFAGLSGCVMIASGLVFWMQARIRKHEDEPIAVRVVRALSIGSVTGIVLATAAYLVANRLLPKTLDYAGLERASLENTIFFLVWALTYLHAALRAKNAWKDHAFSIFVLGFIAVLLNWVTTGDHIFRSLSVSLWPIAGMDLVILAGTGVALWSALKLTKKNPQGIRKAALKSSFTTLAE